MTEARPWSELALQPDQTIADSQVFHGLRETQLELADSQSKDYVLICDTTGLQFKVELTGILSQHEDDRDPYRPSKASANLRQVLHGESGSALSQFLRYSPWLIADLKVEGGLLEPVQLGAVLARLLYLLVTALEDENLTGGRLRDTYWLLLRSRFVLLARLHREHSNDMGLYLPDLNIQVREAWHSWGRTLFQSPQEVKLLLVRYGCRVDDEGRHLIFVDEHNRELWSFALTAADRPFTLQLLSRWFLPHYDLHRVMRALGQMPGRLPMLRRALPMLQLVMSVVAAVGLILPLVLGLWVSSTSSAWEEIGFLANLMWGFATLLVAGAIALAILLDFDPLRYSLPRITLSIIVGYVALVSSSEIMTFAIQTYDEYPCLAWATAFGSTLLAFMAIYVEARRRLDNWQIALGRAGLVLLIAAARSLTLGWLILAPAGGLLLYGAPVIKDVQHKWVGPLGLSIYPQLIFVLAPLALFIGIFVQTIWEEHPLTHPI